MQKKTFKTAINMFKYPMENKNIMRKETKKELSRGENTLSEIKISLNGISRLVGKKDQ